MTIIREERIGNQRLILGDCLQVMPTLGRFDAVVTDPPYGMKWDGKVTRGKNGTGKAGKTRHFGKTILNDNAPFDPSPFIEGKAILFGANHFPQHLRRGANLVWVKRTDAGFGSFLSDAEVAWFSEGHGVYCFRDMSMQGESSNRFHPTQKPVALMEWCLGFLPDAKTILDPFAGSGTTLVACQRMGRAGTGIELDPDYFDIACKRVDEAARQPDLLIPETRTAPVQQGLDL